MAVKPISPSEAQGKHQSDIPDGIIEAFNELIVENLSLAGYASFKLKEVIARARAKGVNIREALDQNLFDVEPLFRAQGWEVKFDNPGYNESYEAVFTFSKKRE